MHLLLPLMPVFSFVRANWRIALIAALALAGFFWWRGQLSAAEQRGWDRRDAIAQSEAYAAEQRAGEIILENIADAAARDHAAQEAIERQRQAAATRTRTLSDHLAQQEATRPQGAPRDHDSAHAQPATDLAAAPRPLLGHAVLDRRTVGLLDAARRNDPLDPAPGGAAGLADAEGAAAASAPTNITGRHFAENDLEVVRLYHELATRHGGLVDWVNHQCVPEKPHPANP